MNPRIYLDYNAGTPIDPRVLAVIFQALQSECGNPSSLHYHGRLARQKLEESRRLIANYLKAKPQEIIFTSGGTEGAHVLMSGILLQKPQGHMITSSTEHACIYRNAKQLEKRGYAATYLNPSSTGEISLESVKNSIRENTRLIVLMAANNETGVKIDWEAIADLAFQHGIPFVLDGVSLLGKEPFKLTPGVTAAFFSGHKIYAPKGIGFCFCRQSVKLLPTLLGGHQEYDKRAGTQNLSAIIGLAEAVKILQSEQTLITAHLKKMRDLLENRLTSELEGVRINGEEPRVVNTTNLSFDGVDGESLLIQLDLAGIAASHGSACSSGALEPSRILTNMGLPLDRVRSSIRFSVGKMNTEVEIEQAIAHIIRLVRKARKHLN